MRELNTIQKRNKLNSVYAVDGKGSGNANHLYEIYGDELLGQIAFQHGGRNLEDSISGITNEDLLEIVRDRLIGFQESAYACRENEAALNHIEEALMWMNRRTEDRFEQGVLGTNKIHE